MGFRDNMKFFSIFGKREQKDNPVGKALVVNNGMLIGGAKEGRALVKDGYQRNVIVYRAVTRITTAICSIKFELYQGDKHIESHPILDLLKRPNPKDGKGTFFEEAFTNYLLTGEMIFSKAGTLSSKAPKELWNLNPLDIKIAPGNFGLPLQFVHKKNNVETKFDVNPIDGTSDIFFMKMYNPDDYWRGQPPLRAAALAADAHNEGLNWNYNLMRKGARPSGMIKAPGAYPAPDVVAKLKAFFRDHMQGGENAGEVGILSGGAEFTPFEVSAKDMDFVNGMQEYAKYVSSAYGVPLPLIDNDAASMNNMEQAKELLWTDTVIPHTNRFLECFNAWLVPFFGAGLELRADLDDIPALEGVRARKFDRTIKAKAGGLITINEGRDEIGYDEYVDPNADKIFVAAGQVPIDIADVGYTPAPGGGDSTDPSFGDPGNDPGGDPGGDPAKKSFDFTPPTVNFYLPEQKNVIEIPPTVINITSPEIKFPAAPKIEVKNEVRSPDVHVAAPVVNVTPAIEVKLPARQTITKVHNDKDGNITGSTAIEHDI